MFSVGLDVDTRALVFTELHQFSIIIDEWEKILLYAGNFSISSPILFIRLGKIYLTPSEQSAGNFTFSTKATAITKNTYNSYLNLPKIILICKSKIYRPNVKILLNINIQSYHTAVTSHPQINIHLLNPYFVTGLIDAEGCFTIRIRKNPKSKLGWSLEAMFVIDLHPKDIIILKHLKDYFKNVGNITLRKNSVRYYVSSLSDLNNYIIPHFLKYPLITQKKADFILFNKIID